MPFSPGGNTDLIARLMAEKLSQHIGKPFIVENRSGAGGLIAAEYVARAKPDGQTLFMSTMTQIVTAPMTNRIRYDPIRDFAPIINVGGNPSSWRRAPAMASRRWPTWWTTAGPIPAR